MNAADLLPSKGLAFERAIASAGSDDLPVPLEQILDPLATPAKWLAWLAANESVDLWFDDWSDARKRQMVAEALELASIKGTRAAAERFLSFVDARIIYKISHPARFPVGRIAVGITPINHKPFVARYVVMSKLTAPINAICVGRSAVGRAALRPINREPLRRAKLALSISKASETAYSVTFAHRLPITLDDGTDLDAGHKFGDFKDRITL